MKPAAAGHSMERFWRRLNQIERLAEAAIDRVERACLAAERTLAASRAAPHAVSPESGEGV